MKVRASILALLALAGAQAAFAHFGERTDSLYGFAVRSDLVVIGRVTSSKTFEEKGHTTVPGAVRLRVDEVLHGELPSPEVGILIAGMHQPRYADGEQVLVFAERRGDLFRSLQSRSEKITLAGKIDAAVEVVRRYVKILAEPAAVKRTLQLKELTLDLLRSPEPRLHQDAIFDLSRPGLLDAALTDRDLSELGTLALDEEAPLVVREGIAAKLGVIGRMGRREAFKLLPPIAVEPANPAVRVAAINALAKSGHAETAQALIRSLDADDVHVRRAAAEGLGALRAASAVAPLAKHANDPDPRVAFAALRALFRIDGLQARSALERIAKEGSPEERKMVAQAAAELVRR